MTKFFKRFIDLSCVFAGLFLFGPVSFTITLLILLDDGPPILFRQNRLGRNRKEFQTLKFRTMRKGQITRIGHWIRKTGLDELPQLINIFNGEMSVVGPRPLTAVDVQRLGWEHKYNFRWALKPGITGLGQIGAGKGAKKSIALDRLYTQKMSPTEDIKLIVITLFINIFGKRRVKKWVGFAGHCQKDRT